MWFENVMIFFFFFFFLQNCRRFHCLVAMLDLVAMVTKVRNTFSYGIFVCLKKKQKKNNKSSELRQHKHCSYICLLVGNTLV